jgi:type VI secretion system protein ImpD
MEARATVKPAGPEVTVAPAGKEPAGAGLLDAVLQAGQGGAPTRAAGALEEFLGQRDPWQALAFWLSRSGSLRGRPTRDQVARLLLRDIARLDGLLSGQVNAILHHPRFQQLEASWRGLRYLVEQAQDRENVKVRVLDLSWKDLARDLDKAIEFDQSQLFKKIYEDEFGTPGGEPYGVLLGDYAVRPRPGPDHPTDDLATLGKMAGVAAAAFAPFIAAAHPSLLDLGRFTDLERPLNLARNFAQPEYLRWRSLRQTEDSRFVGLVLPRVLARLPYADDGARPEGFRFREEVAGPDSDGYLWGNAVYAFGGVLTRAFGESGWLADIRGLPPDGRGGGLVTGLPAPDFPTDRAGLVPRPVTDASLTDQQEKELSDLGLIPLCHCPDTGAAVFYGNQSVQQPRRYDEEAANANARLSAMLQYMLCVARFAHYLKVIGRDKLGSFSGPQQCEDFLHRWLLDYTLADEAADPEKRAKYPLREYRVQVREHPGKPGSYLGVFHLRPHLQFDQVSTGVRLVTELAAGQGG